MDSEPATHEIAAEEAQGLSQELVHRFPGYLVTRELAKGGMGTVYLARDTRLDRNVAIKELVPNLENNPDAVQHFFEEAGNTARLRHENIIRGLDVGRTGDTFYFVMEYVNGETVQQKLERLERGRIPEREALQIIMQVADALQYIFEHSLVHRDIKPGNILLGAEGKVKLCDLGVARELCCRSAEEFVKGSPAYASPEQIRGEIDVDIRADLYGLGCTWFHMLIGQPPFRGVTREEVMRKHLDAEPPNPRELNPRLSAASSETILWLLRKNPDERPRTPKELISKLQEHPLLHGG